MRVPRIDEVLDERFLAHRLRATSLAAQAGGVVAGGLFLWRYYTAHVLSWDLFAVLAAMVVVKIAVLIYYRLTD